VRTLVTVALGGALVAFGYNRYGEHSTPQFEPAAEAANRELASTPGKKDFSCDGRQYCSQMTSCDEAKAFLRNCPGMKMDGDHDGIPCEQQFCNQ